MASRCQQPVGDMWRLPHPHGRVATNPRRPPGMYERLPSYAHRAAGVHQARVPHLVGAPCGTTAPAGPHRLMPVLVPAVVPLVPSNKANESSLHGAALPTESTLRIQASGVHDRGAITSRTVCLSLPRLLTRLLTNRYDLDRSSRYSGGRSLRSAQLPWAAGSWLTRKRSLVQIQYRPPVTVDSSEVEPTDGQHTPRDARRRSFLLKHDRSAAVDPDTPALPAAPHRSDRYIHL